MAMATETRTQSQSNSPSFIMVLLDNFPKRLPIPPNFVQNFGEEIPKRATLKVSPDKSWKVDVVKDAKKLSFQKGWEIFVENNNLEYGDFLMFTYCGNSMFEVIIFGKTGCEKEDFAVQDKNSEPHVDQENQRGKQIQRERKSIEFDDAEVEKNVIRIDSDSSDDDKISAKKRPIHNKRMQRNSVQETPSNRKSGKHRALFPNKARDFNCQYPNFQVKMTTTYLTRGFLPIPPAFSRKYLKEKNVAISVETSKRTWNLKIYTSPSRTQAKIGGKWAEFARENGLKKGDECLFEMIKSDDIVFRVHISRC